MKITELTKYQDSEEIISRIEIRDEKGQISEEIDFNDDGQQLLRVTYKYNEKGQTFHITQYDEEDNWIEKKAISYNEDDKISSTIIEFPDGSITKESQQKEGNIITITTEDEDGEFEGSLEHTINEKGLTTKLVRTNFVGKVDSVLLYEYDEQGNTTKLVEQDAKGHFIRGFAYLYDENGNRIAEDEINKKGKTISRTIHKYEEERLKSTISASESTHFYYENDLLIKEETLQPDGSADVIVKEYDNTNILVEKHYSIPQGETPQDMFLMMSKRYLYEE